MLKSFFILPCTIFSILIQFVFFENEAYAEQWSLKSSVQRILQEAPQQNVAEAVVQVRQGKLNQAGIWPNPRIEIGVSNSMGKDDGEGGTDLNLLSISQPLPLSGRLGYKQKQENARLEQAKAENTFQALMLEYDAARVFHVLQFSYAQLSMAEQRLKSANEFQRIGRRREQAGDLSRLERLRLDLVRESAKQDIALAEGELNESIENFQTLLHITEKKPILDRLKEFPANVELTNFVRQQESHPALIAAYEGVNAAGHGVDVESANRFVDPEIWLAGERDFLGDSRQNFFAFGISVTVPLWNQAKGNIEAARANKRKKLHEVEVLQLKLGNRLRSNYLHLQHLIEQGRKYRINVLEPAEEIFQLTRKGFASGQVEILNLVDAVDTYFNARVYYLKLQHRSWLKIAALRISSGISLLNEEGTIQ